MRSVEVIVMELIRCSSCKHRVTPVPPRSALKVLNVFFWVASLAVAVSFALIVALNVVLVPVALVIALSVGVSARRASSFTCPECKEELPGVTREPEQRGGRVLVPQTA